VDWYVALLKKVAATPESQAFMKEGAFDTTFKTGADFAKWLTDASAMHKQLMQQAGFIGR
jgi:putative tricarboxylic transport membrane protein